MTVEGWYKDEYPATVALDGVSPGAINSSCAHPVIIDQQNGGHIWEMCVKYIT